MLSMSAKSTNAGKKKEMSGKVKKANYTDIAFIHMLLKRQNCIGIPTARALRSKRYEPGALIAISVHEGNIFAKTLLRTCSGKFPIEHAQ